VCGVTEPFEFAFMFLAPGLYLAYAALYGIFTYATVLLGFRAGFSFSAGLTDLIFSASLPAAAKTWMIIPLGIAAFAIFYGVFRFAITKFDLKTPGREEDDEEASPAEAKGRDNDEKVARALLEAVGGADNVVMSESCFTRLRLELKDTSLVDEKAVKQVSAGFIKSGASTVQIVIGPNVQFVADAFKALLGR
ncbi:MAG: PTS transporter subunit EIIB, partial [Abditibacteriota bacterium]|nr:PTS transporter subunit EIIB [Abditibacteriota bacterium]